MIELRVLGTAEIRTEMATLTPSQDIVFAVALFLAMERTRPTPRSHLSGLIWPKAPRAVRSHRLRQTLLQLKKLGFRVRADRETVTLDIDVADDPGLSSTTCLAESTRSITVLPGYTPDFSTSFGEWLDATRNRLSSRILGQLVQEIGVARSRGEWTSVDALAEKCLDLDPFNEEAVLAKAEAAVMRGSKARALAILDDFLTELGGSPQDLKLPTSVLRRRIAERIPDRPPLVNSDPTFVGREKEMASITAAFEEARAGRGCGVLVIGEAGIGKTRLSTEFARFAQLRGARVQSTACRRADVDRPLSLFVDIVPELRELPGSLGCAPETFSLLKRLTEFDQRAESARQLDNEPLFERVQAALFDLLESIAEESCLMLVIDDVQWLDKASASLLARMSLWCKTRRIFLLLNARPGPNSVVSYLDGPDAKRIKLGPLSADDSETLLKSLPLVPTGKQVEEFLKWCLPVAEGNPFFLQEFAHQWIETGEKVAPPRSITRVLDERLSRLSAESLHVLQTASLLADFATIDRVEQVLGYAPHTFLVAIEELDKAAMLQRETELNDTARIRPKHDFLASAAVQRLSPVSQTFLHRRCAETLETDLDQPRVSATLLWACATHRHLGGDREKALSLRISCAEHLVEMGLAHDACATYRQTLNYCTADADRLKVLPWLARGLELDGQWNQSIEVLRECMALQRKITSAETEHNDYELQMLEAKHRSSLDFAPLLEQTLACVNTDKAPPKHKLGAAVIAMKIAGDFGRGDLLDAIYKEVAPHFGDRDVNELHCAEINTIYATMRGPRRVPTDELNKLVELGRAIRGELGYSRALMLAANACRLSGRYKEGLEFATRALNHAEAHRFYSKRREILAWTIALHNAAGRFDEARRTLTAIVNDPFPSDSAQARSEILLLDARVSIEEGDFARAAALFRQAEPVSPTYSLARKCYYLALDVRLRVNAGGQLSELRPVVVELERLNTQLLGIMGRDFESYSLFVGLQALGEEDRGRAMLKQYLERRRDTWPVSSQIQAALAEPPDRPISSTRILAVDSRLPTAALQNSMNQL